MNSNETAEVIHGLLPIAKVAVQPRLSTLIRSRSPHPHGNGGAVMARWARPNRQQVGRSTAPCQLVVISDDQDHDPFGG